MIKNKKKKWKKKKKKNGSNVCMLFGSTRNLSTFNYELKLEISIEKTVRYNNWHGRYLLISSLDGSIFPLLCKVLKFEI